MISCGDDPESETTYWIFSSVATSVEISDNHAQIPFLACSPCLLKAPSSFCNFSGEKYSGYPSFVHDLSTDVCHHSDHPLFRVCLLNVHLMQSEVTRERARAAGVLPYSRNFPREALPYAVEAVDIEQLGLVVLDKAAGPIQAVNVLLLNKIYTIIT